MPEQSINDFLATLATKPLKILVTGGRNFGHVPKDTPKWDLERAKAQALKEHYFVKGTLDALCIDEGDMLPRTGTTIIHGGATGADAAADEWAVVNWAMFRVHPANWERDGHWAGGIRNQYMLDIEKPDLVVAFPGSAGTRDMVSRAHAQGFKVLKVKPDE